MLIHISSRSLLFPLSHSLSLFTLWYSFDTTISPPSFSCSWIEGLFQATSTGAWAVNPGWRLLLSTHTLLSSGTSLLANYLLGFWAFADWLPWIRCPEAHVMPGGSSIGVAWRSVHGWRYISWGSSSFCGAADLTHGPNVPILIFKHLPLSTVLLDHTKEMSGAVSLRTRCLKDVGWYSC